MEKFYDEICQFLQISGLYIYKVREGNGYISVKAELPQRSILRPLLLLGITADSLEEAISQHSEACTEITKLKEEFGNYPLIISEDRWIRQKEMTRARLLAHLEIFSQIYARNCVIKRIDKAIAQDFLEANHSYGDAACKYRYGLYLKRHTGHNAHLHTEPHDHADRHNNTELHCHTERSEASLPLGTLVAVATFSNARKWIKGDKTIRSYEWTRYASLPGIRLSGGMGKVLKSFIQDINPDDIMTYADLEWSEGKVYEQLGFALEGIKEAVTFEINSEYRRLPHRLRSHAVTHDLPTQENDSSCRYLINFGSNKYRLKLTDYQ